MPVAADPARELVLGAEARRVAVVARVSPAVVAIYDPHRRGGGSGVIIDPRGYGLTNYHVIAGLAEAQRGWGGLPDGQLYELEVLGADPIGDLAMFRLGPGEDFPFATLGDSDAVRVGDTAIALGNPFNLSDDNTPTVTLGIVTGVHRYQWGVGGNLIYSDCIQIDTPINPGNSGGPLFNERGEIIGINGRISVNTRGRFNVGFGYAIAANQIKRFMPALRAGLLARHGTLQAVVEQAENDHIVVANLLPGGAGDDAGIRVGDRLLALDNVPVDSPNHFASLLGTYPGNWHVLVELERGGTRVSTLAKLDPITPKLRRPFAVRRELNHREVARVLRELARATRTGVTQGPPRWHWTVHREHAADAEGRVKPPQCLEAFHAEDGFIRVREYDAEGVLARWLEFDGHGAAQRSSEVAEAFALPAERAMVLSAQWMLDALLGGRMDENERAAGVHAGGDVVLPATATVTRSPEAADINYADSARQVEIVEWPLGESAVAAFGFDLTTHDVLRIAVRDIPTGIGATILLSDHRPAGGVRRPCRVEVVGPNYRYVDTLTDWEALP
ncbi:MAG: trypsin-like peptidase domain-containing protein [Planctomycetes bacterium]|nr:trypsin-like peptidase domain-containing protein [Planctomycetota bacterium]